MRISDWSSDVCSSDLGRGAGEGVRVRRDLRRGQRHRLDTAGDADGLGLAEAARRASAQVRQAERDGAIAAVLRAEQREQGLVRSEEHTSELQSLMRISYAVFCLKKKKHVTKQHPI